MQKKIRGISKGIGTVVIKKNYKQHFMPKRLPIPALWSSEIVTPG